MNRDNMTFEILMSCMNQKDFALVDRANIHSNILVVNQCDRDEEQRALDGEKYRKMICSTQRGLSRSRNLALEHAKGDILLFADDDEIFVDEVEKIILDAFHTVEADIIAFDLYNYPKNLKKKVRKLYRLETLKVSSCQIACKREAIEKAKLRFDVNLGTGTSNGAGEENKFLWDAYKAGLSIFYFPCYIASLSEKESTWFSSFDKEYFYKRGKVTGYYMGKLWAIFYAVYFVIFKYRIYKRDCSFREALISILKGIYSEKNLSDI